MISIIASEEQLLASKEDVDEIVGQICLMYSKIRNNMYKRDIKGLSKDRDMLVASRGVIGTLYVLELIETNDYVRLISICDDLIKNIRKMKRRIKNASK